MSRKRKTPKIKKLTVQQLEQELIKLFKRESTTRFAPKQIAKHLNIGNSKDSIEHVLDKLLQEGFLAQVRSGKYKLNKFYGERSENLDRSDRSDHQSTKDDKQRNTSIGVVDMIRSGAAYIACEGEEDDIYVPASKLKGALNKDTVKVRWKLARRGKPEGVVISIESRFREAFIGTLVVSRQFAFVMPDDSNLSVDILVDRNLLGNAADGDKVVVVVDKWHDAKGKPSPSGRITTVLGKAGSSDIEMKSILINNGFNITFPQEVLDESEAISTDIAEEEIAKRRDMREVLTFTIDPADAKDFDDALSIQQLDNGNYEIGVHIADVSHYVQPNSELDKEAAKRTTSVYLVDRVLPMLPEKLSNGLCSLRPQETKLTFSAIFEFSPKGDLEGEWFGKTVTFSDRRFAYEDVQEILESGEGDYADELRLLNSFAHKMRRARFKHGAMNFESPEVRFELDKENKPVGVYLKHRKDAHMLIEDFMLLANKRVGALIYNQAKENGGTQIPFVYRVHDTPDMEKVANFAEFAKKFGYNIKANSPKQVARSFGNMLKEAEDKPEYQVLQQLAIRTMAKAAYSSDNIGHYGLAFDTYSHFTSPIRRYADVLAHRILFDFLEKNNKRMKAAKLEELCVHISKKERSAMEAERESVKYKQTEYLQDHIGAVFQGVISGIADHGIYVKLSDNYCEGMIRYDNMFESFRMVDDRFHIRSANHLYKMGDAVWVRVLNTNLQRRQVDMELLDPEKAAKEFGSTAMITNEEPKKDTKKVTQKESVKPDPKVAKLFRAVANAFAQSEVKEYAEKNKQAWNFHLTDTAITEGGTLLLQMNPKAKNGEIYEGQDLMPTLSIKDLKDKFAKKSTGFIEEFLPKADLEKVVSAYFCPFRVANENQLSAIDLERSLKVFKELLKVVQPKQIIVFSNNLRSYLDAQNQLKQPHIYELYYNKQVLKVAHARIRVGRKFVSAYFLPNPGSSIANILQQEAWKWAFEDK